jgi:hypothetical protein
MQPSQHLQVETDQATSTWDVGSSKKTWLWMVAVGVGCFALGVASACLVLASASPVDSLHKPAHQDLASYVPMSMRSWANTKTAAVSEHATSFLPTQPNGAARAGATVMQAQSQLSATRRGALAAAGAALGAGILPASAAIQDPINMLSLKNPSAAAKEVLSIQELLNAFVGWTVVNGTTVPRGEEAFVTGLVDNDASAPQLPRAVPFTTFQSLEKTAGPEFMEIAIDYAEAMRNARDLYKLGKLTKQQVTISSKEPGKPRQEMQIEYGAAENSGLASTKEYATRAFQEAIGASVALNAAVDALPKK